MPNAGLNLVVFHVFEHLDRDDPVILLLRLERVHVARHHLRRKVTDLVPQTQEVDL